MTMLAFAKREIEIAKAFESRNLSPGEFDYGGACYDSALRVYASLMNDDHSGASMHITKDILNRLIDGKPLTPIEDTDDIWNEVSYDKENGFTIYQCQRMSSLFKNVYDTGEITYNDINAAIGVDVNTGSTFSSGLVGKIVNDLYPITFPYHPASKPIKVHCDDFLMDEKNGDFDTVEMLYLETPNGKYQVLKRYFKETPTGGWLEIDEHEARIRRLVYYDRRGGIYYDKSNEKKHVEKGAR